MTSIGRPLRVVVIAYKIEAGRGSEDESGYQFVRGLVRRGIDVTLISRANNCEKLAVDPEFQSIERVPVDVPRWASFYKRGGRGIIPYYYSWQLAVGRKVRALLRQQHYDTVHLYNFHGDWAPHFLPRTVPVVWGPIAHHQLPPPDANVLRALRPYFGEVGRWVVKAAFWRLDPFLRRAVRRSAAIVYANPDVAPPFRRRRAEIRLRPYAASNEALVTDGSERDGFRALYVGRLVPLKGPLLAIDAWAGFLARCPGAVADLHVVGAGPLQEQLIRRIGQMGLDGSVTVRPWLDREALAVEYRRASVLLYPSFEAQGLVVSEAMASGVPVIGIAGTGPAFLCGASGMMVPRRPARSLGNRLAENLVQLYREHDHAPESYRHRRASTRREYQARLDWPNLINDFLEVYEDVAGGAPS